MTSRARYGWESDFPAFRDAKPSVVRDRLAGFITDASPEQIKAWDDSIPPLQREVGEVLLRDSLARRYTTILEYELPMEFRRPDAVLLITGGVVVIELKGKAEPSQADIDQAAAYARDLRCYHRECELRPVIAVLVPTRACGYVGTRSGVHIVGPDALDELIAKQRRENDVAPVSIDDFLAEEAYRPLPSLVEAARELFHTGDLRAIKRARSATDPAVESIAAIIHEAAVTKSRRLVLVTGVPGSGKTLVGLRTVHAHFLDDLAVPRNDGKPTAPAVFLSGNGPLVEVLQYELRNAGGDGKTFVRGVKEYVRRYSARKALVPPEHVLVFDEAQRAFDAEQVQLKHAGTPGFKAGQSEPEHFIEFAERIPGWCVVIGLIGGGQEIHVGEEAGLGQWRLAVERSRHPASWTAHGPLQVQDVFEGSSVTYRLDPALNLDTELRFHAAQDIHRFVEHLVEGRPANENARLAHRLEGEAFHLRITRDLDVAKQYLRDRYRDDPTARFGMIASSRDKDLKSFGIPNDYQDTKNLRVGPWYGDPEDGFEGRSCRLLQSCVTEFGAQGLELDATLVAWGTDFVLQSGHWSNANAKRYRRGAHVKDPFQLRKNAYRVLLTRGRDACVVFVPRIGELDGTYQYLVSSGFVELPGAR